MPISPLARLQKTYPSLPATLSPASGPRLRTYKYVSSVLGRLLVSDKLSRFSSLYKEKSRTA